MSEKKKTEGKTTGEIPGNDTLKKDSGFAERFPFPLSNAQLGFGIMGGRKASLAVRAKGDNVTSYGVAGNIGGGELWEQRQGGEADMGETEFIMDNKKRGGKVGHARLILIYLDILKSSFVLRFIK